MDRAGLSSLSDVWTRIQKASPSKDRKCDRNLSAGVVTCQAAAEKPATPSMLSLEPGAPKWFENSSSICIGGELCASRKAAAWEQMSSGLAWSRDQLQSVLTNTHVINQFGAHHWLMAPFDGRNGNIPGLLVFLLVGFDVVTSSACLWDVPSWLILFCTVDCCATVVSQNDVRWRHDVISAWGTLLVG